MCVKSKSSVHDGGPISGEDISSTSSHSMLFDCDDDEDESENILDDSEIRP